ncbi:MAG TPA: DUF6174 domain-containing protein [Pyrinomonadaceae bacterium]|jgi:hypothetical protein
MKILATGVNKIAGTNFTTSFQILSCLIIVLFLSSCSASSRFENQDFSNKPVNLNNAEEREKFEEISREIEKNRSLWREKNISDYDFVCERRVEGEGGDFIITIKVRANETLPVNREDVTLPVIKDNNRFTVKDINNFPYYKETNSIEKLFDYIQRMLEEGYRVKVTFNNQYGFPEQIEIITLGNGWISIKIKQFQIVK